jgi:hypothetical protein
MPPNVTSNEAPRPPRPGNQLRRAFVVVVALVFLLVVAVWKPWEAGGTRTSHSTIPPGAAGSLLPAITSDPGSEASPDGS